MIKGVVRFFIKILMPVLLLGLIFSRIDFYELKKISLSLKWEYCVGALIVGYMSVVFLSVMRWKLILAAYFNSHFPYKHLLKWYWQGTFIGYFVPAGLGCDVYRVAQAGKYNRDYEQNAVVVMGEKLFMLLGNILVLMVTYPLVHNDMAANKVVQNIITSVYFAGIFVVLFFILVFMCTKAGYIPSWSLTLKEKTELFICRILRKKGPKARVASMGGTLSELLKPLFLLRPMLIILGFTICNRLVGSLGGSLMLAALGVELPFVVNLFIWTFIYFVFTLPVSFGTLGVREGTFILILGLFGVGTEPALAASFIGFVCLIITTLIGGGFLLVDNLHKTN